jgi:hypothetical protein
MASGKPRRFTRSKAKVSITSFSRRVAATVRKIHELLKTHLGDHPTLADANRIMSKCVEDCIAEAGGAETCLAVFTWAIADEKRQALVAKPAQLGGYLRKCFTGWAQAYEEPEAGGANDEGLSYPACRDATL